MKLEKVVRQTNWTTPVLRIIPPTDDRVRIALATNPALAAAVRDLAKNK